MDLTEDATEAGKAIIAGDRTKEAIHRFLFNLINGDKLRLQVKEKDPVWVFIGLQSLKWNEGFEDAHNLTPKLARLKYAMRSCIFREALIRQKDLGAHDVTDSERLFANVARPLAEAYLNPVIPSSYSNLVQLSKYASSIAYNKPPNPHIGWNEDFTVLQFDDRLLRLSQMRSGFKANLLDIEKMTKELLLDMDLPVIVPSSAVDPMADANFDTYLNSIKGIQPTRSEVIDRFLDNPKSTLMMIVNDEVTMNKVEAVKWLAEANKVCTLTYW